MRPRLKLRQEQKSISYDNQLVKRPRNALAREVTEVIHLTTTRIRKLRRRQRRKRKLRYLRRRLAETEDPEERQRLIAKIRRISPWAPVPDS